MNILNGYILVEKLPKKEAEGFEVVETQDDFIYKGKVIEISRPMVNYTTATIDIQNDIKIGDIVIFAKYSPDTHEIDFEGRKVKFVKATDVLAVE